MRYLPPLYLALGIVLLGYILHETDFGEVFAYVSQIGWGFVVVLLVYHVVFAIDSFTWQMALTSLPLDLSWLRRMYRVRLVGEALNAVMPAAGFGGEPVKAILLKRHYDIGYHEGIASVVLGRTMNMFALIPFLAIGFALMVMTPQLPSALTYTAAIGLAAFVLATGVFFAVQRLKLSSLTGSLVSRGSFGARIVNLLKHIQEVDERFVQYYTAHRSRMLAATLLSFVQWLVGALEVYFILLFLGNPVTFGEAWIIEAVAQLVRAATFFIPSNLGAMEGGFLVICAALTGSSALGIATAVIRRLRELIWIVWGFAVGWRDLGQLKASALE